MHFHRACPATLSFLFHAWAVWFILAPINSYGEQITEETRSELKRHVSSLSEKIKHRFIELTGRLNAVSAQFMLLGNFKSGQAASLLNKAFLEMDPSSREHILLFDEKGSLAKFAPTGAFEKLLSANAYKFKDLYFDMVKNKRECVISEAGVEKSGEKTLSIYCPVFKGSKEQVAGMISASYKVEELFENLCESVAMNGASPPHTWIVENNGNMVYNPMHPGELIDIKQPIKVCVDCHPAGSELYKEEIFNKESGSFFYSHTWFDVNEFVAYQRVEILGHILHVIMEVHEEEAHGKKD